MAAGGFTADASRRRVQVSRVLPPSQRDATERARVVIDVTTTEPNPEVTPAFPLEPGDADEALHAAEAIGDDTLQKQSQGVVVPESFTHGTSAQRQEALMRGYRGGTPQACANYTQGL